MPYRISISQLPSTIKKLAFRNCEVVNISQKGSYLKQMVTILPLLETLDLINGRWLSNHSLLAISNSQTLHSVNLSGCNRIGKVNTVLCYQESVIDLKVFH